VPPKSILFQFGTGDLEVPNPAESAIVRAANGKSSTSYFRYDEALKSDPYLQGVMMPGFPLPILPHRVLSNPTIFSYSDEMPLALAEQKQAAGYFESNGASIPDPNLFLTDTPFADTFETPITALPEGLNFQLP
jgi:hypothetical protein